MIIIPARLHSTRFPQKVLVPIEGVPMVVKTAQAVSSIDKVAVAADSEEIMEACKRFGIEAVMTSPHHVSGTDRINEAATRLGLDESEIVINVQADEPFIEPHVVETLKALVLTHQKEDETLACSLYKSIDKEAAADPNLVKVVTDQANYALYFSRSRIPYDRDETLRTYKGHLGLYGFVRKNLARFCTLPQSFLEKSEKLEQLRILSHGYKIAMTEVVSDSFGIDTPEDLARALKKD